MACAELAVPLDWKKQTGERIKLALIRHPASKPEQRMGSIFINPGGPGDTGVGLVRDAGNELDAWGAGRFATYPACQQCRAEPGTRQPA